MSFMKGPFPIKAFSHSRLKTYEDCPRKARYKFVDRLREPSSPAAERGINMHKELEDAFAQGTPLPEFAQTGEIGQFYGALHGGDYEFAVEQQVAFDREWGRVDWFAPNAFMRVVFDLAIQADNWLTLVDHKTGKIYPEHDLQEELYALAGFYMYPEVEEVEVRFAYIDQDRLTGRDWVRSQVPELLEKHNERIALPMVDTTWATSPGPKCRWCFFRSSNGGPCPHG